MTGVLSGPLVRVAQLAPDAIASHREWPLAMPRWNALGPAGRRSLARAGIDDMPPPGGPTQAHLFGFDRAAIATRCGAVVLADGRVLADTLDHRHADDALMSDGVRATLPGAAPIGGAWLSLLLGGAGNLFHFALMNLGRAALLGADEIAGLDGVLVPDGLPPAFATLLDRVLAAVWGAHDRPCPPRIAFGPATSLRPDRLLLPMNVAEVGYYLPQTLALLRPLAPRPAPHDAGTGLLYISRADSAVRPLRNESRIAAALAARGFACVSLAGLDLDTQAGLFARAGLIVAPHGAGLANLVFARPGTRVIEVLPDRLANWCYRRLAASLGLRYDVVIGRAEPGPPAGIAPWQADLDQLLAALDAAP